MVGVPSVCASTLWRIGIEDRDLGCVWVERAVLGQHRRAELFGEPDLLLLADVLVTKEDNLVLDERSPDSRDGVSAKRLAEIQAAEFGPDHARHRPDLKRSHHWSSVCEDHVPALQRSPQRCWPRWS